MFKLQEDVIYYITLYNENYQMPPAPKGAAAGILKGLYKAQPGPAKLKRKAHLLGSGPLLREALRAQQILAERFGVSADVWSATSYSQLRREALEARRWNLLHPTAKPKRSYLETILEREKGVFVAVSDYVKTVPDQIAPWVPGGLLSLGTDGFGRSDTRQRLRRYFEVDAEMTVIATLYALAKRKAIKSSQVARAIRMLDVNPEKTHPLFH